jgi:hypothetical protein
MLVLLTHNIWSFTGALSANMRTRIAHPAARGTTAVLRVVHYWHTSGHMCLCLVTHYTEQRSAHQQLRISS